MLHTVSETRVFTPGPTGIPGTIHYLQGKVSTTNLATRYSEVFTLTNSSRRAYLAWKPRIRLLIVKLAVIHRI